MIYFIKPHLTLQGELDSIIDFYNTSCKEVKNYMLVTEIDNMNSMRSAKLTNNDHIIYFNTDNDKLKKDVLEFLLRGKNKGSSIYPIAINKEYRIPPHGINEGQSYDIIDQLRQRDLQIENISIIGSAFARELLSKVCPTLNKSDMNIFISHRRKDGEELAAKACRLFRSVANQDTFRDIKDIKVGENAQEIIEDRLKSSDVVLLLDTPRAAESDWLDKEINIAIEMNIPIIWVRIGDTKNRINLRTKPADEPHFNLDNIDESSINIQLIEDIIKKAFEVNANKAIKVFDYIHNIEEIANTNGIEFKSIDNKDIIYKLSIPRRNSKYVERPIVHLLQCYGRNISSQDRLEFKQKLINSGYCTDSRESYDEAIALCIDNEYIKNEDVSEESFDNYIEEIIKLSERKGHKNKAKGIIISGSFPKCDVTHQQRIKDSLETFTKEVLRRNGTIIFGSHPTFQPLIFKIAKNLLPKDYKEHVHMYISKYFNSMYDIDDLNDKATVYQCEAIKDNNDFDINKSLTHMRKEMINDKSVQALVCIGGKTEEENKKPGIDEEIKLAIEKGIPVFLIGSTGGRVAEICNYYEGLDWQGKLNELEVEDNRDLMTSLDYTVLANKILDYIEI